MRALLLPALALLALPATAQTQEREVRRVVIEVDSLVADGGRFDVEIESDEAVGDEGDARRMVIRRRTKDGGEERIVEIQMPDRARLEEMMERTLEGPLSIFRSGDGGTMIERMLESRGASSETLAQTRVLEAKVSALARRAREADGRARRDAEAELDGVLAELFELRAQARRERAESLRERADALAAEADEIEAALADRQSRRAELIEARRRALLDGGDSDW